MGNYQPGRDPHGGGQWPAWARALAITALALGAWTLLWFIVGGAFAIVSTIIANWS